MARQSPFFPHDDLTAGEEFYLLSRYPEAEAAERRERLIAILKRVVRRGKSAERIHRDLMIDRAALARRIRARLQDWRAKLGGNVAAAR